MFDTVWEMALEDLTMPDKYRIRLCPVSSKGDPYGKETP